MLKGKKSLTRKKFLLGGLGLATLFAGIKLLPRKNKLQITRMLSEEGKLVEVDMDKIKKTGVKLSDKDVITWLKNKPVL